MGKPTRYFPLLLALAGVCSMVAMPAHAHDDDFRARLRADLDGFEQVPAVVSSGHGTFRGELDSSGTQIDYTLSYGELEGEVAAAHIHIGQRGANGGVSVFLCSNLGDGPAETPVCPPAPAEISGTIMADDVIDGAAAQGVSAGELDDLIAAIRSRAAYVNVHSDLFPGGEIRGQIRSTGLGRGHGFGKIGKHGHGHAFGKLWKHRGGPK